MRKDSLAEKMLVNGIFIVSMLLVMMTASTYDGRLMPPLLFHPTTYAVLFLATIVTVFSLRSKHFWRKRHDSRIARARISSKESFTRIALIFSITYVILWLISTFVLWHFAIFLNCNFDKSEPTAYTATITDVYVTSGARFGYKYYAEVENVYSEVFSFPSLRIARSDYQQLKGKNAIVRIYVKDGLLGYKWIFKTEIQETNGKAK